MTTIVTENEVKKLEEIIDRELLGAGAAHVIVVDMSGNLVMERGSLEVEDIPSLAVLSAANFAATAEIAKLIGEEDFSLLFHKGDKKNVHFSRLGRDRIMITLFGDNVSLGLIRIKSNNAQEQMVSVLDGPGGRSRWHL